MENNKKKIVTKVFVLGSGLSFLCSSIIGLSNMISQSLNKTTSVKNAALYQNAELQASEKGFLIVLKREPKNQTALNAIQEILTFRMQRGDFLGTKALLEKLVETNLSKKEYQQLLTAVNQEIANTKKAGTLESTQSTTSTQPSK